ncbi:hypothetical protein LG198_11980 [Methylobacillus arboreus]|uniref:hypothetical protein n=1 Tax=Methylobacillus arboreus TaxID=755170 RepID=UPI001E4CA188|nr:hypothetical protein [Methylobacillus arboreus]MCB5191447.1 hypothetical protein [Methylobacillus arboreus]
MESLITKLKTPSPHHQVKMEAHGFTICPLDESVSALEDFQPIAEEAIRYAEGDYKVVAEPAESARGKYGKVFFNKVGKLKHL